MGFLELPSPRRLKGNNLNDRIVVGIIALGSVVLLYWWHSGWDSCNFRPLGIRRSYSPGTRSPAYLVKAYNGAVATENELCSKMGVAALVQGGNAVDAVVSANMCLGVVNMFS